MRIHRTVTWIGILLSAACASEQTAAPDPIQQQLDALREVTKNYQSIDAARSAGYTVKITECMTDAQGAMGYHYGKGDLIDGTVAALQPEVLMYEPTSDGKMKLVGVEYVVPFDAWTGATPPALYGQNFQRNETFKVWALHAWVWKDNPNGVFASWNPQVSCAHATTR